MNKSKRLYARGENTGWYTAFLCFQKDLVMGVREAFFHHMKRLCLTTYFVYLAHSYPIEIYIFYTKEGVVGRILKVVHKKRCEMSTGDSKKLVQDDEQRGE